jgi:hypothetical protein
MKLHTTALFLALSFAATSPLYAADDTGAPMSSGTSSSSGSSMESSGAGSEPSGATGGSAANGGYGAGDAAARDAALQAYEAAKEDCRKLSTGAQADCLEDAAAAYAASQGATPSDTTAQEPTANPDSAMDPVGSTGMDPRGYEEAKSKCDTLTEDQRNVCLNDLKTRYPQE